jgi:hypothetical protein
VTELRIFSYLPNPRIWKATIVRDDAAYAHGFAHFNRLRRHPAFAPDVEPYLEKIDQAAS